MKVGRFDEQYLGLDVDNTRLKWFESCCMMFVDMVALIERSDLHFERICDVRNLDSA